MAQSETAVWPREGYLEEWLALEDASGGRYQMVGDFNIDCPTYNAIFSGMSKQWPQFEDSLEVWDETTDETCNNTKVRVYKTRKTSHEALPLLIFFHGGGFITGTLDTEDAQCRYFAANTPCIVVSIDYPKVLDPDVNLDVIVGNYGVPSVIWSQKRASALGADISKTILFGGSAGAMICAQIAYHYSIEKGDRDTIAGLLLFYGCYLPYTYGEKGKYRDSYNAFKEHGRGKVPIIHQDLVEKIWSHYDADFNSPRHFAGLADDLSNWPTTYLVSAEKDVFRDDTKIFQEILDRDNVPTRHDYYQGLPHWFHAFPMLGAAQKMMAKSVDAVKFVLENPNKSKNGIRSS